MRLCAVLLAAFLSCLAGQAASHALQPGYLELKALGGDVWQVYWKVPATNNGPMPIIAVLPEACADRRAPQARFDGMAFGSEWITICPGGLPGGTIQIEGLEQTATDVLVRYELSPGVAENRRLTPDSPGFIIPQPQGWAGTFRTYLVLGIDHILTGFDHLTFVFALILLIPDRRKLVGAVTAFTLAHSASLAAVTLGWFVLPSPPVEAVIALSIMFLASALVRPSRQGFDLTRRFPWIVTFSFGLLHGMGFARALLDIGLPEHEVPLALVAFNLGVEAGQLMFITAVLVLGKAVSLIGPGVIQMYGQPGKSGRKLAGYAIGGIASFWLVSRLVAF